MNGACTDFPCELPVHSNLKQCSCAVPNRACPDMTCPEEEEEEEETLFVNGMVTVGAVQHNNKTVNTISH